MPLPISQAGKVWQRPLSSQFLPEEAPGVQWEPLPSVSGLVFSTGLSPSGELCKWKSGHCQAAWKDSFPWSHAVISGLPPTYHFPPPTSHPLLSSLWGLIMPNSAEEKLINACTRLSPPPLLAFEKVVWWLLTEGIAIVGKVSTHACLLSFTLWSPEEQHLMVSSSVLHTAKLSLKLTDGIWLVSFNDGKCWHRLAASLFRALVTQACSNKLALSSGLTH